MSHDKTYCKQSECGVRDICARYAPHMEERDENGWVVFYESRHTGETCGLFVRKEAQQ